MEVIEKVLKAIAQKKAGNICVYDCRSLTPFQDLMIIASTSNLRQNQAIVQNIKDHLKEINYQGKMHVEGNERSPWVLVDLGDIVVHLFVKEERQVYSLDRLYADCPMKEYDL